MIDIHHHCIPGVDDGPRDLPAAVDLCRMAIDDGIDTIIATPHVLRGDWQNRSRPALETALEALRQAVGDRPRLYLGSEYYFDYDMAEVLRDGQPIIPLAGSRYVLVEFESHSVPPLVDQPFYRAQLDGWTPVIAHPERNSVFQSKPEMLTRLVQRGARVQITAGSFLGDFGSEAMRASRSWLKAGLVHFVASDAHNVKRRPPRMGAAYALIESEAGLEVAEAVTSKNPACVLAGTQLDWEPEIQPVQRDAGLFGSLGRFWRNGR